MILKIWSRIVKTEEMQYFSTRFRLHFTDNSVRTYPNRYGGPILISAFRLSFRCRMFWLATSACLVQISHRCWLVVSSRPRFCQCNSSFSSSTSLALSCFFFSSFDLWRISCLLMWLKYVVIFKRVVFCYFFSFNFHLLQHLFVCFLLSPWCSTDVALYQHLILKCWQFLF